jgi:hypothetical protein
MILKIYKPQYLIWWSRLYNIYRITTRSVLFIDGQFYNIDSFEGRLSKVYIDGKLRKIGIRRTKGYRYEALKRRGTICNHIKQKRYKFDLKDRDCEFCYIASRCSMVKQGWRKRSQLVIKDLMIISRYFEENGVTYGK